MSSKRKKYSVQEKVRSAGWRGSLLRLHLIEKELVSDICDRHGLNPNVFYRWQDNDCVEQPTQNKPNPGEAGYNTRYAIPACRDATRNTNPNKATFSTIGLVYCL